MNTNNVIEEWDTTWISEFWNNPCRELDEIRLIVTWILRRLIKLSYCKAFWGKGSKELLLERKLIGPYLHQTVSGHTHKKNPGLRIACISDPRISSMRTYPPRNVQQVLQCQSGREISQNQHFCSYSHLFSSFSLSLSPPHTIHLQKCFRSCWFLYRLLQTYDALWNSMLTRNFSRTLKGIPSFMNSINSFELCDTFQTLP